MPMSLLLPMLNSILFRSSCWMIQEARPVQPASIRFPGRFIVLTAEARWYAEYHAAEKRNMPISSAVAIRVTRPPAQFDQQIKEASDTIMRLTSERNSVMGGLAEQQSWLEQFRKYANIKELTRSTVVNLIDYIHIRENKDIDVGLMHCDRFASIVEFLRERQEKEDANKVIRFERKVV